jgi:glutamate carboxypeptidase
MDERSRDERITRHVGERQEQMVSLLERLVNTDSGTYHKPGTDAIGRILAEQVRALGFQVEVVP